MTKSLKDEAMDIINEREGRMLREAKRIAASVRNPFLEAVKNGESSIRMPITLTEVKSEEIYKNEGTFYDLLNKCGLQGLELQMVDGYKAIKVSMPIKKEK